MKFRSSDFLIDKILGKVGTPKRDEFERRLADELAAIKVRRNANGKLYETK